MSTSSTSRNLTERGSGAAAARAASTPQSVPSMPNTTQAPSTPYTADAPLSGQHTGITDPRSRAFKGNLAEHPTEFGKWLMPFLVRSGFANHIVTAGQTLIKMRWTDFDRAVAQRMPQTGLRALQVAKWITGDQSPSAAHLLGALADLLEVPRMAVFYHAGAVTLTDLVQWLGPMPPHLLTPQQYQEQMAGLQALPDPQLRDVLAQGLLRDLAWSQKMTALALSAHDYALLTQQLNTEWARESTRYALADPWGYSGVARGASHSTPSGGTTHPPVTPTPQVSAEFLAGIGALQQAVPTADGADGQEEPAY